MNKSINSFDIDGVIFMGSGIGGVYPGPNDIIITGRSIDEKEETERMLASKGIYNKVYFNPIPFEQKTRELSGEHKAKILNKLLEKGENIRCHYDDDAIQIQIIRKLCPKVEIVFLQHNLTEKENIRHYEY